MARKKIPLALHKQEATKPVRGDVVVLCGGGTHKWRVTCVEGDTVYVKGINHGGPQEFAYRTSAVRVVQSAGAAGKTKRSRA